MKKKCLSSCSTQTGKNDPFWQIILKISNFLLQVIHLFEFLFVWQAAGHRQINLVPVNYWWDFYGITVSDLQHLMTETSRNLITKSKFLILESKNQATLRYTRQLRCGETIRWRSSVYIMQKNNCTNSKKDMADLTWVRPSRDARWPKKPSSPKLALRKRRLCMATVARKI